MSTADIEHILSKLKSIEPKLHTKIFGAYNHSSRIDGNDNVKKRQANLISHSNEALRTLKVKGVNLGNKETPTIRAALVIDYLVRNIRNDSNPATSKIYFRSGIPIPVLMDILRLGKNRKKDLEQMQILLGSYLRGSAIATKITSDGGNGSSNSNKQNARSLRKRNADGTAISTKSAAAMENLSPSGLIRDLCINLGPLIPDAEFVFKYATKIFDALANNVRNKKSTSSSSSRRREQDSLRQDMARCLDCYEGACFYLAVKESEGANYNDVLKKKASAKMSLKNQQKIKDVKKKNSDGGGRKEDDPKNNNYGDQNDDVDQDDEDDTDDDRPMNEMDVVMAACLSERTFKTVLAYVKEYAQDIVISLDDTTNQKKSAKKQRNGARNDAVAGQRFGGRSVIVENDINSGKSRRRSEKNVEFEQWKRKVLDATISKWKGSGDKSISKEEAIKCAAEEVVRELQKSL
mmetsp:Transcript_10650/g.16070  ORF Transcript_10650/g.16070 Transcript_10650/m.16070 type:complete len:463 (-) Transcript_10650:1143-2531(-)|eukprot:scaffold112_cov213-Skeletonema_dohrnii-CCMP3373.AAC.5